MNFKSLRQVIGTVVAVAILVFSTVISASPAIAADTVVEMGVNGTFFAPNKVTVSPGDTITFKMAGLPPHNVVFEGALAGESIKDYMFAGDAKVTIPAGTATGDYGFYCEPHRGAGMIGTVTVQ